MGQQSIRGKKNERRKCLWKSVNQVQKIEHSHSSLMELLRVQDNLQVETCGDPSPYYIIVQKMTPKSWVGILDPVFEFFDMVLAFASFCFYFCISIL